MNRESTQGKPIPVERAREIIEAAVTPAPAEVVPLSECLDRHTATNLHASDAVPPFDNSAMDGYPVRSADLARAAEAGPVSLTVIGESRAGHPAARGPGAGEAVAISTGAMMPEATDAVIPVEQVTIPDSRQIEVNEPVIASAFVRRAGDDLKPGDLIIPAGRRLGPPELGSLATAGLGEVRCARRPQVTVLTTGDELAEPGEQLGPGQIRNASAYSIPAQTSKAGALPGTVLTVPDDPVSTAEAIAKGLDSDLLIICGGVSVGPHDHVKPSLDRLGVEQLFWRVAVRPGGPLWFGLEPSRGVPVFGLPGNPVSAMVTFHLFARRAIAVMLGADPDAHRLQATFIDRHQKPVGRTDYARCRLTAGSEGWQASLTRADQSSHVLTSMIGADALAEIPAEREKFGPGEPVTVEVLPH